MAQADPDLTPKLIAMAYRQGYFPMATEDGDIDWYLSHDRAIFPVEGIRMSRSLRRTIARGTFEIRFDTEFEAVMRACRRPKDNWIDERLIRVYVEVHREGWAHSVECFQAGRLVGGLYGVSIGACFCAESMFHTVTDASKVALHAAVEKCRELGFRLFDAQVMSPHLASMGAVSLSHEEYLVRLRRALRKTTVWSRDDLHFRYL
ncbi:MAG: Leucyl/phenylalanyl-tRNA--protein transferase [Fimbriimonadaceae bacterium]|nr:Leucyl/phenylalanyl-tRNA--protein transferase [Fimbriimonadaceae bacterium]